MSVPATIRHVISDTGGEREDGGAQLKANLEPDRVPLSPDIAMVDSDDEMDGHGNRCVKAEGPSGVYVCPEPECGFTALKESLLNGHVVVMHQLGRDYPDPEERSPIPEVELDGSEVEFVGTGRDDGGQLPLEPSGEDTRPDGSKAQQTCQYCGAVTSDLDRHQELHWNFYGNNGRQLLCSSCDFMTESAEDLKRHTADRHQDNLRDHL